MTYDAIIVGGSFAGISAAMAFARARRQVLVIDAGNRRNRFAHAAHGFLGQDGRPPGDIIRDARAELSAYPTVIFVDGTATSATKTGQGFAVILSDGTVHESSRLVLATGVVDQIPDLPGLREQWGQGVFTCPYCHGYEVAGGRLGVLALLPPAAHHALLINDWGNVIFFVNEIAEVDDETRKGMTERGIEIVEGAVAAITGEPGQVTGVQMRDGRKIALDAVFAGMPVAIESPIPAELGCEFDETPIGSTIRVDQFGETTVPGVYAVGDCTNPRSNIASAVAGGYFAGVAAHRSLVMNGH